METVSRAAWVKNSAKSTPDPPCRGAASIWTRGKLRAHAARRCEGALRHDARCATPGADAHAEGAAASVRTLAGRWRIQGLGLASQRDACAAVGHGGAWCGRRVLA